MNAKIRSVKGGLYYEKLIEVPACEFQNGVKFMSYEQRIKYDIESYYGMLDTLIFLCCECLVLAFDMTLYLNRIQFLLLSSDLHIFCAYHKLRALQTFA